jgi:RNA 3'-terminal phosphate cyclase (ATP)
MEPDLTPLLLDGQHGEGGGQILRTALTLSLVTGRAFRISGLRAKKSPAGLRPQHLACVRGAEAISGGRSAGGEVGSTELEFTPGTVKEGRYLIDVGPAGSATLVFQCLYYPLALAGGGELTLRGATHAPHSPSYHYLVRVWLPAIRAYGLRVEPHLRHAGFPPEGNGEFRAAIPPPTEPPTLVDLPSRGTLQDMEVMSFVGGVPFELAGRQGQAAAHALREHGIYCTSENLPLPTTRSGGSAVFILGQFENTFAGFTALGDRGADPEGVGQAAAAQVAAFMQSAGALEENLADQLLVPAGLLAAGKLGEASPGTTRFTTSAVTPHLSTNAWVIEQFLPVTARVDSGGAVSVEPRRTT